MHWIDPESLIATKGTVERFLFNPDGVADGLIFKDGTEVHFPPHLSSKVLASVRVGDAIAVRGVKPRGADMLAAVALELGRGRRIVDKGEEHHAKNGKSPLKHSKELAIDGKIRQMLHGPKGSVRGVLLEDGTAGRFAPHLADALSSRLRIGRRIALSGEGYSGELGTVVDAEEIGTSPDAMTDIRHARPKHKKKHRHDKHASS